MCRPRRPPPSPAVLRRPPLFSVVFRFFPPSPAVPRRPPPSSITPYKNMSQIVGLVVLPNDGRPGNSRTRTDGILSSRPVIFSSCPTSRNERRGRTTFCRPALSRALGSSPPGPTGAPDDCEHWLKVQEPEMETGGFKGERGKIHHSTQAWYC